MSERVERARHYHAAIKNALLHEWDPIGVEHIPEAQDEYDSYVVAIYKLLISNRSQSEIFDYLWWLETNHMGLSGDRQATQMFAERLSRLPTELDSSVSYE